jgi:hypothetical protein
MIGPRGIKELIKPLSSFRGIKTKRVYDKILLIKLVITIFILELKRLNISYTASLKLFNHS